MTFKNAESGQGLVEYAIILVLAAIAVIAIMACCLIAAIIPLVTVGGGSVWLATHWELIKSGDPLHVGIAAVIGLLIISTIAGLFTARRSS